MNTSFILKITPYRFFVILITSLFSIPVFGQTGLSSDSLFHNARDAAFKQKNYPLAIQLSRQALLQSPKYDDIRVFLGRLYTWNGKPDSARTELLTVLKQKPDSEDAALALTDLEYWSDNNKVALTYCDQGLQYHPGSTDLLIKKIKILKSEKRYMEAYQTALVLLQKNPANTDVRSLILDITDAASLNKVSVGYDFTWFDHGYGDYLHKSPWQIINVDYTRFTSLGSITGRVNYGKRFGNTAFQAEIDAYPHIMKGLYAYTNLGLSDVSSVFPHYRAGASLYATLPKSFELELGFRYLNFSNSTWIYVGGLSKYYKSFLFNARVTLVPGNHNISHSYTGTVRYYVGGADDYFYGNIGYGLSPDDANAVLAYNNGNVKLISKSATLGLKRSIKKLNVFSISASLLNQEYHVGQKGNQVEISVSYQRRF
ncbi:YaiO family outer membrane beta-barrel protein [Paludibacter sp.]|uniref:YaiO family outer membrane beta-barrel protein n=1 Tax=Paludibacter sp. TaxID=1898105 RepID=UPI00135400BC|nr:YaiO family outer membrane beta-barrel protein [Paludibacter sp.]MTK52832.1 YaiO family outer membrane beta-barrel protein [Paludibacter sp.]